MPNDSVPKERAHSMFGNGSGSNVDGAIGEALVRPGRGIRVVILEDHRLMREMLMSALAVDGFQAFGAGDPTEFFRCVGDHRPDVALIDLTLDVDGAPDPQDGFSVLQQMRVLHPEVRLLVFSATSSVQAIERSFRSGAQGYLLKSNATVDALGKAIERVMNGERIAPAGLLSREGLPHPRNGSHPGPRGRLTDRERQVLGLVASGANNQKIAQLLHITERTVKAHVSSLYRKLGSENRVELAIIAQRLGPPAGS